MEQEDKNKRCVWF